MPPRTTARAPTPLDGFDCDGNCLNDVNGNGICDEFEVEIEVQGCTNPDAVNFNPEATVDDGSCLWDTCVLPTLINPYYPAPRSTIRYVVAMA